MPKLIKPAVLLTEFLREKVSRRAVARLEPDNEDDIAGWSLLSRVYWSPGNV